MSELKNYAELKFSNPIILDVFGTYMPNSLLATIVSQSGEINLKFKLASPLEPPKNCEQVVSLLFALLESNAQSPLGQAYAAKRTEILRDTVFRLSQILEGFSTVKLVLHITEKSPANPETEVAKHTEFTLNRKKSSTTSIQ